MISECCKKAHDSDIIDIFIDNNDHEYFGISYHEEIKYCPFCGKDLKSELNKNRLMTEIK